MTELILHHYELSPFSEKVRRMLAFKGLEWRSVRAPAVMPKPELVALTGGYRKIPVLQRENHVYCDTALIARLLERLAPAPSLFADPLAESLAEWADSALFDVVVPTAMRPSRLDALRKLMTPDELQKIGEDRKLMGADARRKPMPGKLARTYLAQYLARFDGILAARPFLLGQAASAFDFSVYHCTWFLEQLLPEPLLAHAHLRTWMQRIAALPDTQGDSLSSEEALRICADAPADSPQPADWSDPMGLVHGQPVSVRALDYGRDPVAGLLVSSTPDELVLSRSDARAGTVFVHFPRLGYEVEAAQS